MTSVASPVSARLRSALMMVSEAEQELKKLREDLEQRIGKAESEDQQAVDAEDVLESSVDELGDMISELQNVEREGAGINLPE